MELYQLHECEPPWGDYGHILFQGLTSHIERLDGLLQLERTGPMMPPITFPGTGDIVATNAFRATLEASGLTGISFRPVIKRSVVRLDWHLWDLTAEDPAFYPEDAEPELYVLDQPHSPEAAEALGELWEVVLEDHAQVIRLAAEPARRYHFSLADWDGTDLFRASGRLGAFASPAAKAWLELHVPDWVSFEAVEIAA